jgi:hypothetical protein
MIGTNDREVLQAPEVFDERAGALSNWSKTGWKPMLH